jgi:hypothetical protein
MMFILEPLDQRINHAGLSSYAVAGSIADDKSYGQRAQASREKPKYPKEFRDGGVAETWGIELYACL